MLGAMVHESFYLSAVHSAPELGVYGGSVVLDSSLAAHQPFVNERKDVTLLLSGECFQDSNFTAHLVRRGHDVGAHPGDWLVHAYEELDEHFFESLNGLFSGLLIDLRKNKAFLFNDRYGFDRLYVHETGDEIYFASEVAPLFRVLPHLREFDQEGVNQFLAVGCTLDGQTLFRGVRLLPAASAWSVATGKCVKKTYFSPKTWEAQPVLSPRDYQSRFQETFSRIVPRYFASDSRVGIALTAGLDSRMALACRPSLMHLPVCYTYGGRTGETLDARIAARVAHECGMEHHVLRIGSDFFSDFGSHVDRTIRATSGCFGVLGAHEVYLNRRARELAPVRLTGVCGGEVLREVCTFKPLGLARELLAPKISRAVSACARFFAAEREHPVTFAAFREIPWNIHGTLAACRSQVTLRTPFLDNEIVALAYQASPAVRNSFDSAVRLIQHKDPALATIATDKGWMGAARGLSAALRRLFSRVTFKFDYLCNEGLPSGLSSLDPVIDRLNGNLGVPGLHKFLWYRRWFRGELAPYIREQLHDPSALQMPFWNSDYVRRLAESHIKGYSNCVKEINAVLTLAAIHRLLIKNA
jgi:asparagine synthase (glutamine-hydrolysing)